jgi:hypothetical protein
MYVCLSSGALPRYREDILRALAMPAGSHLQFRYHVDIVASAIREPLKQGAQIRGNCLIAALTFSDLERCSKIIPCRAAEIVAAQAHGSTYSLTMELGDFSYADGLDSFNKTIRRHLPTLGDWDGEQLPHGDLWSYTDQLIEGRRESLELELWENIVSQLVLTKSFATESLFYCVKSIHRLDNRAVVRPEHGRFTIPSGKVHEIEIYHSSPLKAPSGLFHIQSTPELQLISSSDLVLDSNYDLKRIRFSAGRYQRERIGILALYHDFGADGATEKRRRDWHFDLTFRIRGSFWYTLGLASLVGLLLTLPQMLAAVQFSKPPLSLTQVAAYFILSLLLNSLAAAFVAFRLRRDI